MTLGSKENNSNHLREETVKIQGSVVFRFTRKIFKIFILVSRTYLCFISCQGFEEIYVYPQSFKALFHKEYTLLINVKCMRWLFKELWLFIIFLFFSAFSIKGIRFLLVFFLLFVFSQNFVNIPVMWWWFLKGHLKNKLLISQIEWYLFSGSRASVSWIKFMERLLMYKNMMMITFFQFCWEIIDIHKFI